ncbi:hypothetical protein DPMN_005632 [Dreissena polymorpha]|uniref:Ricin B lectin domain-containing protein n=2 Tax=Dreissena polymorpha TaxID=45954 RepID=A0A9D4MQS3_DREPO|nr:hypothetical protein DPMN_005632 [Dreissena polymorpha]
MARVWIDPPFLDLFEDYVRDKKFTTGDLTKRRAIRERNKCQPYQYFVDVVKAFSEVYFPVDVKRFGHIYNKAVDKCLDVSKENNVLSLILYKCHPQVASNQYFTHTSNGQIRSVDSTAVSVVKRGNVTIVDVTLRPANWGEKKTLWDYRPEGTIVSHLNQQCLTATRTNKATIAPCSGADTQCWAWGRT